MRIKPLRPLVPASNDEARALVCPPYDTLSTGEARQYLKSHPDSFMTVIRPEATLPADTPPYHSTVYTAAATALEELKNSGRLVRASGNSFYVYQQQMQDHIQRGLVALASVRDYDDNVILRHEKTRPEKENDRTKLTDTLSANTGPVFLTYRNQPDINELIEETSHTSPLFQLTTEDDVHHTVWTVDEADVPDYVRLFEQHVHVAYIADGHHRAASAARVARERGQRKDHQASDSEWFLSVLFPHTQLQILSYNRLVKDLNGMDSESFLANLGAVGTIRRIRDPADFPTTPNKIYTFVGHSWYELQISPNEVSTGKGNANTLAASLLQHHVLKPILGISDPRKSTRIKFVGGIRGIRYLEEQVCKGTGEIAFVLCPVTVEELMQVSDAGEIMPPKSTWFEPKLRSGFFVHTF